MKNLEGRYAAICADPPWQFRCYSHKGEGRSATAHYDCVPFGLLCKLPIGDNAGPNCALFLWATDPMIPQALELVAAWGFTYKTIQSYWAKLTCSHAEGKSTQRDFFTGMGYLTYANSEQCILATGGRPASALK